MNEFDFEETTPPEVIGEQIAAVGVLAFCLFGLAAIAYHFLTA